jgi:hypothetical protein
MHQPTRSGAADGGANDSHATYAVGRIREALQGMRFGEVRVVVHDGVIVQVERTEKLRLTAAKQST